MDSAASPWKATLVSTLLKRIDTMSRHWLPDKSVLRDLGTLIEQLRSEDAVCVQLSTLLHYALANPHAHTLGMVRGLMLAIQAHIPDCADNARNAEYKGPGLTALEHQRVLDYVNTHLETGISLTELAAASGLRHARFSRTLKHATGVTPQRWVLLQRVEHAKHLLVRGELSLSQIAIACGFSSQSHLTRMFDEVTGTTPRKWCLLRCRSARARSPVQKT